MKTGHVVLITVVSAICLGACRKTGSRNGKGDSSMANTAAVRGGKVVKTIRGKPPASRPEQLAADFTGRLRNVVPKRNHRKESAESHAGAVVARVRLLTYNIYGLKESRCGARAKAFGRFVARANPRFDIVGVQEYYKALSFICEAKYLRQTIHSTGLYKHKYRTVSRRLRSRIISVRRHFLHNPRSLSRPKGGLGVFSRFAIVNRYQKTWPSDRGTLLGKRKSAGEGFIFTRIKLPANRQANDGKGFVLLDLYNVHVNSGKENHKRRMKQLAYLARHVRKTSARSGNPVVVMGDFNIGGPPTHNGNPGYQRILNALGQPVDLFFHAYPRKPGFTYDCRTNAVNRAKKKKCKSRSRIDFIFLVQNKRLTNSPYQLALPRKTDVRIMEMQFRTKKGRRSNVSDHYGLAATIEIRRK